MKVTKYRIICCVMSCIMTLIYRKRIFVGLAADTSDGNRACRVFEIDG